MASSLTTLILTFTCLEVSCLLTQALQSYSRYRFPNPHTDPEKCGHGGNLSWVCDPGEYLSTADALELENIITVTYRDSPCRCESGTICGYIMSIAVVPEISGYGTIAKDGEKLEATKNFAKYLNQISWDFGICHNDLVSVLAVKERKVWTFQDTNTNINDRCITEIFTANQEHFRVGDYGPGLLGMYESYRKILVGDENCSTLSTGTTIGLVVGSLALIGSLIGLCICLWKCDCGKSRGGSYSSNHHTGFFGHSDGGGGGGGGGGSDGGGGGF